MSEKGCLSELCAGLVCPCPCRANSQWLFSSAVQVTRVYCHCCLSLKISSISRKVMFFRLKFQCSRCRNTRTWASSRVIGGNYLVNQKYITFTFVVLLCVLFSDLCTPSLPLVYYPHSTHTSASSLVLVVLATGTCRKVHIMTVKVAL